LTCEGRVIRVILHFWSLTPCLRVAGALPVLLKNLGEVFRRSTPIYFLIIFGVVVADAGKVQTLFEIAAPF